MTPERFQQLLEKFVSNEDAMLTFKRDEYTKGDTDVLLNFKQTGDFLGCDSTEVCVMYLMKHVQSITLAVSCDKNLKLEWGISENKEGLAQRFMDARNYLLLLAACIQDQEPSKLMPTGPTIPDSIFTNKKFKFAGDRPEINEEVKWLSPGVVGKMVYGNTVAPVFGHRVKNLGHVHDDEIVIRCEK